MDDGPARIWSRDATSAGDFFFVTFFFLKKESKSKLFDR